MTERLRQQCLVQLTRHFNNGSGKTSIFPAGFIFRSIWSADTAVTCVHAVLECHLFFVYTSALISGFDWLWRIWEQRLLSKLQFNSHVIVGKIHLKYLGLLSYLLKYSSQLYKKYHKFLCYVYKVKYNIFTMKIKFKSSLVYLWHWGLP